MQKVIYYARIDYGTPINVQTATFRAENCPNSCWISVGDDLDPRNNPICESSVGDPSYWIKKHYNLTGKYVSLLGWNTNYSVSGKNFMYFYDIKTWSLPDILPS